MTKATLTPPRVLLHILLSERAYHAEVAREASDQRRDYARGFLAGIDSAIWAAFKLSPSDIDALPEWKQLSSQRVMF